MINQPSSSSLFITSASSTSSLYFMFKEVQFLTQDQNFRDFVLPAHAQETSSRVFATGNSFGSGFSFSNSHLKRFIIWFVFQFYFTENTYFIDCRRVKDNILELIDLCFEQELHNNAIRILLPSHIIPSVSIVEHIDANLLFVFVLTSGMHRWKGIISLKKLDHTS